MKDEHPRLVTPDEMFRAAQAHMLEGRIPSTHNDWVRIVSFFAMNIASGLEVTACLLLRKVYDIPLTVETIQQIAEAMQKEKEKPHG